MPQAGRIGRARRRKPGHGICTFQGNEGKSDPRAGGDAVNEGGIDLACEFLLKKINELTKGESCETNVKLIINNAKHGAKISKELNEIMKK